AGRRSRRGRCGLGRAVLRRPPGPDRAEVGRAARLPALHLWQPGAGHRPLALPIGRAGPGRGSPLLSAERAPPPRRPTVRTRGEEHTSELQSPDHLVCRLLLEKKKKKHLNTTQITFFNTSG